MSPRATAAEARAARRPETWRGQLSELDAIFGRTSAQTRRIGDLLRDVPTYVLTASDTANSAPKIGYERPQSVWELQHLGLALSARNGSQRTVLSSHLVMIDRPEVVVEAVLEMVRAQREGRVPAPLAPSEMAAP